eukprot:5230042-Amphidinium_carterae.1
MPEDSNKASFPHAPTNLCSNSWGKRKATLSGCTVPSLLFKGTEKTCKDGQLLPFSISATIVLNSGVLAWAPLELQAVIPHASASSSSEAYRWVLMLLLHSRSSRLALNRLPGVACSAGRNLTLLPNISG